MFSISTNSINWGNPVNQACPLNSGLVSWWLARPDIRGATFYDLCGRSNGSLKNSAAWALSGKRSKPSCISFGVGGSDYVDIGTQSTLNGTAFTIALWVNVSSSQSGIGSVFGYKGISYTRHIGYSWQTSGKITVGEENISYILTQSAALTTDQWNHFVWTKSANSNAIYLNGKQDGTTTYAMAGTSSVAYKLSDTGVNTLDGGLLDDVRVYDRALSASDIAQLYADSLTGYPRTLNRISRYISLPAAAAAGLMANPLYGGGAAVNPLWGMVA